MIEHHRIQVFDKTASISMLENHAIIEPSPAVHERSNDMDV